MERIAEAVETQSQMSQCANEPMSQPGATMSSINNQDKELAEFFTDVEHLRDAFKNAVAALTLTKRLLVIHGVGGVGKSSLLRMFRLHCKSVNVLVALASGDDSKSALDVLTHWTEDLKVDGVAFPTFGKTFEHYRAIQAKVDTEAQKSRGKLADLAGKAAGKTAETAAAAAAGAALGSIIPGIGTIAGAIGGMGAEALVDWLRGFLNKPDIDLLLDPTKKLTDDVLDDLGKIAEKKRIVLMLDTFEQMTALDDWARDVAQRLPANVLFVIAGRALPNWGRAWSGWMANAQVEELKPMTEGVMRELIRRYYATMRGGQPNPAQVDAIIRFARGLPMVVTSAVQLWVKYGVEDFQSVKAEIVANLVDRLMEGVPSVLIPALEAAAIVRWFDQPILRAVTGLADVRDVYNELRRFPFVRTRAEGLALHDAVREIMDENLRAQDSERHCELHERAAAYFEKRLEKATGEEAERHQLERLYHRVRADEEAGIKLFQEMAEEMTRYRLVNRLRALLNDANTYPLERENNRLWREYYGGRILHLEEARIEAEKIYQSVSQNENAESKLRAYASCDWSEFLITTRRLRETGGIERAKRVTAQSLNYGIDSKLIWSYINLGGMYARLAEDNLALENYNIAFRFFHKHGDDFLSARSLGFMQDVYARQGNWKEMLTTYRNGLKLISPQFEKSIARSTVLASWKIAWAWVGRYAEAMRDLEQAESIEYNLGFREFVGLNRDSGFLLGIQGLLPQALVLLRDFAVIRDFAISRRLTNSGQVRGILTGDSFVERGRHEQMLMQSFRAETTCQWSSPRCTFDRT
jgi:tetratricopeptide (TPR) repeat protein